ncbi:hypothetical protein [uncultured Gammaproteobacteria bacterium]|uniref:hypothetical protein n=1 Tax=Bathymodiolus heckerae thiotrophic gill symbiont TaxID=1052212 RepID=UPI0010B2DCF5|nr:hypothetical protein [Bathymodiolus heckerae thiotrophic gill symbiont]CAC9582320.1 hypothetical protein [uncultured Gammaproteobacteria bacterium]CAC9589318.1 hypothetical protein [uncultured Gammaproteobacteria bacterium]CAC9950942.1 hypothetical protein [uncultured Gammaproteobacteria bacterium]SHN91442.1 hypothetical protein BHECKSOX_1715 [Bathymodiolus heckerae thiotrophic gill symbiont]
MRLIKKSTSILLLISSLTMILSAEARNSFHAFNPVVEQQNKLKILFINKTSAKIDYSNSGYSFVVMPIEGL